jgi:hypothetical protein
MIAVFQTNIASANIAEKVIRGLKCQYEGYKITIDLQDHDHILRMEGADFIIRDIIIFIQNMGSRCTHLPIEWDGYIEY